MLGERQHVASCFTCRQPIIQASFRRVKYLETSEESSSFVSSVSKMMKSCTVFINNNRNLDLNLRAVLAISIASWLLLEWFKINLVEWDFCKWRLKKCLITRKLRKVHRSMSIRRRTCIETSKLCELRKRCCILLCALCARAASACTKASRGHRLMSQLGYAARLYTFSSLRDFNQRRNAFEAEKCEEDPWSEMIFHMPLWKRNYF